MTLTPEDKMRRPKPLKKLPRDCLGNIGSKNFGLDLICGQAKEKSEKDVKKKMFLKPLKKLSDKPDFFINKKSRF